MEYSMSLGKASAKAVFKVFMYYFLYTEAPVSRSRLKCL